MESKQIRDFCIENKLLEEGDRVLLGLSGGADSVCLLFALLDMEEELKLRLGAVHVHHGIRGPEADRDEEFCRKLCLSQGVKFYSEHINAPALANEVGDSLEEAGRKARYEIFNRIADEDDYNKIAVAHHKNDQAETVLFQLARGSRLTGLTGIRPLNGNIIRPLLGMDRSEIEAFLNDKKLGFVTDSTNLENEASRNVLRNEIIPRLLEIQPGAVEHICETADYLGRVDAYLERETDRLYEQAVKMEDGKCSVSIDDLRRADSLIAEKLLYRVLCQVSSHKKDITHRHVEAALSLMDMQTGAKVDFKYGVLGQKAFTNLIFSNKNKIDIDSSNCNNTSHKEANLSVGILEREDAEDTEAFIKRAGGFGQTGYRKLLDFDGLKGLYPEFSEDKIQSRFALPVDMITVYSDGRKKKVSDLLMEAKVPADQRPLQWVAAYENEAFLIRGLRGCEGYRVTDDTKKILIINL